MQNYTESMPMWIPVTIFEIRPQCPGHFYLPGGKQKEKQNLILVGKIHLCCFIPFVRGAKGFSQKFYLPSLPTFVGISTRMSKNQLWLYISLTCLGFIENLPRCSRCTIYQLYVILSSLRHKTVCWSFQPQHSSGPGMYSEWMKVSCPVPLTCVSSELTIMEVVLKIILRFVNVFSHFQQGNESERGRWIVNFPSLFASLLLHLYQKCISLDS